MDAYLGTQITDINAYIAATWDEINSHYTYENNFKMRALRNDPYLIGLGLGTRINEINDEYDELTRKSLFLFSTAGDVISQQNDIILSEINRMFVRSILTAGLAAVIIILIAVLLAAGSTVPWPPSSKGWRSWSPAV